MNNISQDYIWLLQAFMLCICSMMFPVVMGVEFITRKVFVMCLLLSNIILAIAMVNESKLYIPSLIGLGLGMLWHADLKMSKKKVS